MKWTPEGYVKALNFASDAHKGQLVPGTDRPYDTHLAKVAMEVMAALQSHPEADGELAVQCALLHDSIEDTAVNYQSVESIFGVAVAKGVWALTKDKTLPKMAQMQDSLRRILEQPREIAMVKLADRITNLAPPPAFWSREKCIAYQLEAELIWAELGFASTFLADRLRHKISHYPVPPLKASL
jgi:(p)ppGpp synthase/HD superfamily hydrolase